MNGEPASAIVVVTLDGDDYVMTPLFVSLTPSMVLTDHDGRTPDGGGGGGDHHDDGHGDGDDGSHGGGDAAHGGGHDDDDDDDDHDGRREGA